MDTIDKAKAEAKNDTRDLAEQVVARAERIDAISDELLTLIPELADLEEQLWKAARGADLLPLRDGPYPEHIVALAKRALDRAYRGRAGFQMADVTKKSWGFALKGVPYNER